MGITLYLEHDDIIKLKEKRIIKRGNSNIILSGNNVVFNYGANNILDLSYVVDVLYYILRKNSITYSTYKYQFVDFRQSDIYIFDIENSEIIPLSKETVYTSNDDITLNYVILRSDGFPGRVSVYIHKTYTSGVINIHTGTNTSISLHKKILTIVYEHNIKLDISCTNITKDIVKRLNRLLFPIVFL